MSSRAWVVVASGAFAFAATLVLACGGGDAEADAPSVPAAPGASDSAVPSDPSAKDSGAPSNDAGDPDAQPNEDAGPIMLDAGPPRLIEHVVAPKTADPAVTTYDDNGYAYLDTRVPTKGKLALVLAGASGTPAGTVPMLKEVASYGYHTVSVRYVNDYLIVDICAKDKDPDCHGKLRLEALEGIDHSPHVTVPPQNAIEVRLAKLLALLHQRAPQEIWGSFLDGAKPKWSAIVVSGISHGASASGRIGKVRATAGVVMLSGPFDNANGAPAAWTKQASLTPPSKIWGFAHTADPQTPQDLENWAAMGIPGNPTSVDNAAAPYGGSHRLTSARAGGGHGSTIAGGNAAFNDAYRAAWKLMYP